IYLRHGRRTRIDLEENGLGGGQFEVTFTDPVDPGFIDLRNSLIVQPNPSSDRIRVTTSYPLPVQALQILSNDGRQITPTVQNEEWISVQNLPEGLYVLRITIGDQVIHKKIMIK
ncbi:MAG: T9SS type A sorting domain-containing protein, partial [Saprospiraceae bacterium]|nr:T9SS type A sorting domain-containing protein [Saprospiraceae bacterium]